MLDDNDYRAYLKPRPNEKDMKRVFATAGDTDENDIMYPIWFTGGLIFPYTPIISQYGGTANYDRIAMTHSNYSFPAYKNSEIRDIQMSAEFTAQTNDEARYVLAMIRMMSSCTKMMFGEKNSVSDTNLNYDGYMGSSGDTPPILVFNYLGEQMFKDVPVVILDYSIDLPNDVDYVPVSIGGIIKGHVPTKLTLTLTMMPFFNPLDVRENFDMENFVRGSYIGDDGNTGTYFL